MGVHGIMRVRVVMRVHVIMGVQGIVRVRVVMRVHAGLELGRRDAGAQDPGGGDAAEVGRQAAERGAEVFERQAEVDEGADEHVTGRAGETVEVQGLGQPSTPSMLAKTVVLHVREDDVIEDVDPHQDARGRQSLGQPHVVVARLGIA